MPDPQTPPAQESNSDPATNRRTLLKQSVLSFIGLGLGVSALYRMKDQKAAYQSPERARRGLLRPPGSAAEDEFTARCVRCERCSQVCEPHAIRLFGPGTGPHRGTPYIVPELSACNLCLKCGDACPTGAIRPLSEITEASMGTAEVDERLCVSHNGTGICGACFTICPLKGKAIKQSAHNQPSINTDHCVGCGLCENACIVKGDKAIRVISPRRWL